MICLKATFTGLEISFYPPATYQLVIALDMYILFKLDLNYTVSAAKNDERHHTIPL